MELQKEVDVLKVSFEKQVWLTTKTIDSTASHFIVSSCVYTTSLAKIYKLYILSILVLFFFLQQLASEKESQKRHQYGVIAELLRESNHLREELHNFRCLAQIKAEERGQKHRELLRAEVHHKKQYTLCLVCLLCIYLFVT